MLFGTGDKKPRIVGLQYKDPPPNDSPAPDEVRPLTPDDDPQGKKSKVAPVRFSSLSFLLILCYILLMFGLVVVMDRRLPLPLKEGQEGVEGRFLEDRARKHLRKLTSVGARPTGSYENEVLAVDFLRRALKGLQDRAKPIHKISIDLQKPRGSFNLDFIDGLTHHYRDIQNVIAKLESGSHGARDALLINCHFDSVPQSPGASDDAVSCAIMLEILEVLSQSDEPLKHNVIFLFNGAEENMLPGSHGFITQHEWASEVRAFINLEACGAGGRELVFQSGPNHPWMIEAYGQVAPHPFASVIGQEIFQTGVIAGDTDFRIFRDYGNIPGLDLAYMTNGYVYHTKFDTEEVIPQGSIQRAGDNVLEVVKHLANSEVLAHTETAKNGYVVFFDILGLFLVYYPEWFGAFFNLIVVFASVYATWEKVKNAHRYGVGSRTYLNQLGVTFGYQVFGCVMSFVIVILVATFLDAFGRPMSWYSRPYLIFFLYITPTLFAVVAVFFFALPKQKKHFHYVGGHWTVESLYFEVSKLVWTFFTLVMTLLRLQSAYFCMIWVLFPLMGRTILEKIYDQDGIKKVEKTWKWLCIHLLFLTFPLILNMCLIYATFVMFIPIMGRSGSAINPELLIGCKAASMTLATISYLCPLVMVIKNPSRIITGLYLTTLLTMILIIMTPLGFPYVIEKNNLAPHRSLIIHADREFYNKDRHLTKFDSGYFIINLDRNSPKVLFKHVPEMYDLEDITEDQCQEHIFCGVPMYYPTSTMLSINNWIPANKPKLYTETDIQLLTTEDSALYRKKLLFRARGPDHMGIFFSPMPGIKLVSWSFVEGDILDGPIWKDGRPTYYIFYSHGQYPKSWEFWLELQVPKTYIHDSSLLDLSVVGHFVHGNEMQSHDFKNFLAQFPDWSYPVGWSAAYKSYEF